MADWLEIIKESFHSEHIKRNEGVGDTTAELPHVTIVHVDVQCTMYKMHVSRVSPVGHGPARVVHAGRESGQGDGPPHAGHVL